MPRFWTFLCRTWLGLSSDLAHAWWGALSRSRWTEARTFYQAVLRYDQHPAPAQRPSEDKMDLREGTCDRTSFGGCVDNLFCRS